MIKKENFRYKRQKATENRKKRKEKGKFSACAWHLRITANSLGKSAEEGRPCFFITAYLFFWLFFKETEILVSLWNLNPAHIASLASLLTLLWLITNTMPKSNLRFFCIQRHCTCLITNSLSTYIHVYMWFFIDIQNFNSLLWFLVPLPPASSLLLVTLISNDFFTWETDEDAMRPP